MDGVAMKARRTVKPPGGKTKEEHKRWLACIRQRRKRAHARNGTFDVSVTMNNPRVETLIDLGRLDEAESEDHAEIGRAIGELIDELAVLHRPRK